MILPLWMPSRRIFRVQLVVPSVVEGFFAADGILDRSLELVPAGFADVDVCDMEDGPRRDGIFDGLFAYVAVETFITDSFAYSVLVVV